MQKFAENKQLFLDLINKIDEIIRCENSPLRSCSKYRILYWDEHLGVELEGTFYGSYSSEWEENLVLSWEILDKPIEEFPAYFEEYNRQEAEKERLRKEKEENDRKEQKLQQDRKEYERLKSQFEDNGRNS